jgi:hypothetical protein
MNKNDASGAPRSSIEIVSNEQKGTRNIPKIYLCGRFVKEICN